MTLGRKLYWFLPSDVIEGNEINSVTKDIDTGLGHRLMVLMQAFVFNHVTNHNFTIVLEEKYWPEKKLLKFPDNIIFASDQKDIDAYSLDVNDFLDIIVKRDFSILNQNLNLKFCDTKTIDLVLFEYCYNKVIRKKYNISDVFLVENIFSNFSDKIKSIEFISSDANLYLKEKFSDYMGIHLRRSNVDISIENLNTIPENVIDDFIRDYWYYSVRRRITIPSFIPDKIYFEKIDAALKVNSDQKFYISCDVNTKYIQHYKDKYPQKIITKDDIIKKFTSFFDQNITKEEYYMITYLLDIFSLCYCNRGIISEGPSSWVLFPYIYNKINNTY